MRPVLCTLSLAILAASLAVAAMAQRPSGRPAATKSSPELDARLLKAVQAGDAVEVTALLGQGANPNARQPKKEGGFTALMLAGIGGNPDIVRALLDKGAAVNAKDEFGGTALLHSLGKGKGHVEVVRLLLEKGADPEAAPEDVASPLAGAAAAGDTEIVLLLLEHKADPNSEDEEQGTPLLYAAEAGYVDIVRALLAKGADVTHQNADGKTALMLAQEKKHPEVVAVLRAAGAKQ